MFDQIFISERVESYKKNENGLMFKKVMNHYNCSPDEILHIGDSSSDVIGANNQSIDTCWINRHEYKKAFDIEPTFEVTNLDELREVLAV
jgi:putative hydrolase of the HAD superfamily